MREDLRLPLKELGFSLLRIGADLVSASKHNKSELEVFNLFRDNYCSHIEITQLFMADLLSAGLQSLDENNTRLFSINNEDFI